MRAIFLTTPELRTQYWPTVAELVAPAVHEAARGEFTLDDLAVMVENGTAVAGLALEGDLPAMGMVFEFRQYPRRTVINVMALGGVDLRRVAGIFWSQFVGWAQQFGVAEIEALCSPGMTRLLAEIGFAHTYNLVRFKVQTC